VRERKYKPLIDNSAVCICVLSHHGCRRASRADQSNGPPCVSVSPCLRVEPFLRSLCYLDAGDDAIVSRNPLGSVTSKARVPQSVSCGSFASVMPAFFARAAT
jgi:hypothetical protein